MITYPPIPELDYYIRNHIVHLAVTRELQVNRWIDIVSLRNRIKIKKGASNGAVGVIASLNKAGAIDGEPHGIDPQNGYSYKRWRIVNEQKAKEWARRHHIVMMPPAGKACIQKANE